MCSTTRRSAASLLSDPGICELGVGRHGPFGSRRGRSQHRKPRTRTGDAGRAGDKLKVFGEAGFIYAVVDVPPAITDAIRAVVALADLVLIPVKPSPHDLRAVGRTVEIAREGGKTFCFVLTQAKGNALLTVQAMAALSEHGVVAQVC